MTLKVRNEKISLLEWTFLHFHMIKVSSPYIFTLVIFEIRSNKDVRIDRMSGPTILCNSAIKFYWKESRYDDTIFSLHLKMNIVLCERKSICEAIARKGDIRKLCAFCHFDLFDWVIVTKVL